MDFQVRDLDREGSVAHFSGGLCRRAVEDHRAVFGSPCERRLERIMSYFGRSHVEDP